MARIPEGIPYRDSARIRRAITDRKFKRIAADSDLPMTEMPGGSIIAACLCFLMGALLWYFFLRNLFPNATDILR